VRGEPGGVDILPGPSWPAPEGGVRNAFIPPVAIISMRQTGARQTRCLVATGDRVEEGQLIGRAETPDATNVHSSIPGTVIAVRRIACGDGTDAEAAIVEFGGSFTRLGRKRELFPWRNMSVHDLFHLIGERGVPGRSPDEGPLIRTLSPLRQGKAQAILVDCSDAEPYQCAQRSCALSRPGEIAEAMEILMKAVGPAPVALFSRPEDRAAERALADAMAKRGISPSTFGIPSSYPSPSAAAMRARFRGAKGPGGSDADRCPVVSPTALLALYDAIVLNNASIEQFVTVGGDGVRSPATLRARIGTRIGDLIGECGGFKGRAPRLIVGGALTGMAGTDPDTPVLKSTFSVLALGGGDRRRQARSACIRCGECASACPSALDPGTLHKLIAAGRRQEARADGIGDCVRCAACAYVCPSRIPLLSIISGALDSGWGSR